MDIKIPVINSAWYGQDKETSIKAEGKPAISITVPEEFGGSADKWTPEDLFLASVNSCVMMTFKAAAKKSNLKFKEYQSRVESTIQVVDRALTFSKISVNPKIMIESEQDKEKVLLLMKKAEKKCLISQSIKTEIEVMPQVIVQNK